MALTRRTVVIVAVVAVVAVMGFAYVRSGSGTAEEAVGTSGTNAHQLTVTMSQMFVTLENHAGMPLVDLKVGIVPAGRSTIFYTPIIPRIESNGKRVISLGEFRGKDGTPLSLRIHTPQTVTVTAQRLDGQPVEVNVPWK